MLPRIASGCSLDQKKTRKCRCVVFADFYALRWCCSCFGFKMMGTGKGRGARVEERGGDGENGAAAPWTRLVERTLRILRLRNLASLAGELQAYWKCHARRVYLGLLRDCG